MKTKEQQIEELENQPEIITLNKKRFHIYKWEYKPYNEIINKNWSCKFNKKLKLSTFQEFTNLIESGFKMEVWRYYITKHFSKTQWKKEDCLSRCYLNWVSNLSSDGSDLSYYDDYSLIVFVENLK